MAEDEIVWMSTQEAARRLGITPRTLYRFVDEGALPAYKMGRVFRLKRADVDEFLEASRIVPGSLEHLYPESKTSGRPGRLPPVRDPARSPPRRSWPRPGSRSRVAPRRA